MWTVDSPIRLDAFLAVHGAYASRGKAQEAIEAGNVLVNGVAAHKISLKLKPGDTVEASAVAASSDDTVLPMDLSLHVLYEDDACLVIDKPAGIAVHPGSGMAEDEVTILHGLVYLLQERGLPVRSEAVLVHRLDKETTGCLLAAKMPEAHAALQSQFETRTVEKTYLALVAGIPRLPEAVIDAPVGRSGVNRTKMSVLGATRSREAKTTYRTLQTGRECALLECDLHTGRTHQIRVHLHTIGHPILGDDTYSSSTAEKVAAHLHIENLCLHAWKFVFDSPASGKRIAVSSPLPSAFADALKAAGMSEM